MADVTSNAAAASKNVAIATAILALNALQFVLIPTVLLPHHPGWGLLLIPIVLSSTTMWALIHEGVHGHLLPNRRWNDRLSRALSVAFGSPFQLLRFGHLMHHRFNRSEINRVEVRNERPSARDRAQYYVTLFGGLYLGEVIASLLAVLPRPLYERALRLGFDRTTSTGKSMWPAAERQLLNGEGRERMRIDGALVLVLFATAFIFYGGYWWMLALALLGRAFMISFFDNAYHYSNELDDTAAGYNLALPKAVETLILNYNYHAVHHEKPALPWSALSTEFEASNQRYEGAFLPVAFRQLRGPLSVEEFQDPDADLYGLVGEMEPAARQ